MNGLNFVTPRGVPVVEVVTATELACRSLDSVDAHALRAKLVQLLDKQNKVKDQNGNKKEWEEIDKLKKDDTLMVLPADKVTVTVVMTKEEYLEKSNNPLKGEKTYLKLKRDPTSKYRDTFVDAPQDFEER